MAALLSMNKQRDISWKGKTFNQVVAGLKMNTKKNEAKIIVLRKYFSLIYLSIIRIRVD
jgi:hypothetical protein